MQSSRLLFAFLLVVTAPLRAQTHRIPSPPAQTSAVPTYPYVFDNFVWWTNADLRHQLKQRIPNLPDQLTSEWPMQSRIRTALMALLQQKGINAEVQVIGAPLNSSGVTLHQLPGAPAPSISFAIVSPPHILIEQVVLENEPPDAAAALEAVADDLKGKPYSAGSLWIQTYRVREALTQSGHLSPIVAFAQQPPIKKADTYLIQLKIKTDPGPQYHVATITVDGGPLVQNQDLSYGLNVKVGDVATANPFTSLEASLGSTYRREGYADVDFQADTLLDQERALVSFKLAVIPGPQYHLHSLTIRGLPSEQEVFVRNLSTLRVGDTYETESVIHVIQKILTSDQLKDFTMNFDPAKDKERGLVDLSFTFNKR